MQNGGDAFIAIFVGLILAPWVIALTFDGLGWLKKGIEKETQAARTAKATAQKEREKKENRERAQSRYATAYAEYFPKWQAWLKALTVHKVEAKRYEEWRQEHAEWWQGYRERAKAAAEEFERLHAAVEKGARLELELREAEHIGKLFAEVIKKSGRRFPDLGFLREVARLVEHDTPELAYLIGDQRLEAVRHLLPRMPILSEVSLESQSPPVRPERPTPPENIIFFKSVGLIEYEDAPPVPPDKVKWS